MLGLQPKTWRVLGRVGILVITPAIPVAIWYKYAVDERKARGEDVRTRVRIPNVQTVDDIMVEKCKPGDVLLFDRRCENCAAGPVAALACFTNRTFLCDDDDTRSIDTGKFDHCGIVVPGYVKTKKDEFDKSNLLLLEATASEGIVARPLLKRLEMSQSRSVVLLPLASAGEKRNDDRYVPSKMTINAREYLNKELAAFRDTWVRLSKDQGYKNAHSTLTLAGALMYATGMHQFMLSSPSLISTVPPVSPSAWLVIMALNKGAAGQNIDEKHILSAKVEDFLRDHRFYEQNSVRLRPGWKFLAPIPLRETSRS